MVAVLWATCALAQTIAPGSVDEIWATTSGSVGAANISITGSGGEFWFGMEQVDPADPTSPALRLLWYDPLPLPRSNAKTLQSAGDLTQGAIYPSILTWNNATEVLVTGKVDDATPGNLPHLRVFEQDRDDFSATATVHVITSGSSLEHSVPHLSRDRVLPANHLCWTAKNATTEDVEGKVREPSTSWFSSTLRVVSNTSDVEDHCGLEFTYSGRRYTVYHRNTGGTDPDIWLELTDWDGSTWTNVAEFGLTGSDGYDFPSIAIRNTATTAEIGIVAVDSGDVAFWRCGPSAESGCDSQSEFGSPQATDTGNDHHFPHVFIVPRSTTTDTYILAEDTTNPKRRMRILSICGGTGTSMTNEGALPMPVATTRSRCPVWRRAGHVPRSSGTAPSSTLPSSESLPTTQVRSTSFATTPNPQTSAHERAAMALNIKNAEVERLVQEVAALTGETKTGAVRQALVERRERLARSLEGLDRAASLRRFLVEEVWPRVPPDIQDGTST